ncbi:MAG: coproporphyrinogen III oxidase family protein [Bacteroidales bacterium]|nr:coproporphyrinogen III oxidase family protein [Bacteroidales bacterium]
MVYLHVPFCRSFCTYCDFYSEIACRGRDAQPFDSYVAAVCAEAVRRREEIDATRGTDTLYIGGGTPSVLPLSCLERIVDAINSAIRPAAESFRRADGNFFSDRFAEKPISAPLSATGPNYTEFTVEVNPEDIVEKGGDYVHGLRGLGVNRISMGVQSLDDGILRWMNRRHDAARARQAFRILREAGVDNISVDLIFGLSQLPEAVFAETLDEIVRWRPEHVSAYQLSIEPGSALGKLVREGRYTEAPQEQCAAQYRLLCDTLRAAGYVHYEISNWALPGFEAVHNGAYWTRRPYVGLGPAAHSFDGIVRSWNVPDLDRYLAGEAAGSETLSAAEAREEEVMLGLRTARGIPEELLEGKRTEALLADGSLVRSGGRLRIPEEKWFVSDDLISSLF